MLYSSNILQLLFLQFCYSVEIGAYLAYIGHYYRSNDLNIKRIAKEELHHMIFLKRILLTYNKKPLKIFNIFFYIIGIIIQKLCFISPIFLLDSVARFMEKFALFSYKTASEIFPHHSVKFNAMYAQESKHEQYFKKGSL